MSSDFKTKLESVLGFPQKFSAYQTKSPLLRDLQSGNERVKKLSRVFEEKTKKFNLKTNWWLEDDKKSKQQNSTGLLQSPSTDVIISSSNRPRLSLSRSLCDLYKFKNEKSKKLSMIVNEMIQSELTYLQALERGIENYVKIIKKGGDNAPKNLRKQTFSLFGNIEEIFEFHSNSVYPRLKCCNESIRKIAELFTSLIQNDLFYCYISYAINQKSAEQIIATNQKYFAQLRILKNDMLGVNSFIILPIQRLPRYKLFMNAIVQEVTREIPIDKDDFNACYLAEKNLSQLLCRINESLAINDIIETHECPSSIRWGLIASIQEEFNFFNQPFLLVMPNSQISFQRPFNIFQLGKFIKCSIFSIIEMNTMESYKGKVFLFEKCILYTRIISNHMLSYRNHFNFNSTYTFFTRDSPASIKITDNLNKKSDILISSDEQKIIDEMKVLIKKFHNTRISNYSDCCVDSHELAISEILTDDEDDNEKEKDEDGWIMMKEFAVQNEQKKSSSDLSKYSVDNHY